MHSQVAQHLPRDSDPRGRRRQVHPGALGRAPPPGDLPGAGTGAHGGQLLLQQEQGVLLRAAGGEAASQRVELREVRVEISC